MSMRETGYDTILSHHFGRLRHGLAISLLVIVGLACQNIDNQQLNEPDQPHNAGKPLNDQKQPDKPKLFPIGGEINGLTGDEVLLLLNGQQQLKLNERDFDFSFSQLLPQGSRYNVVVKNEPKKPPHICQVRNGQGIVGNEPITNINVDCKLALFSVSGRVSGLVGSRLVLQLNGSQNIEIMDNEPFLFKEKIEKGKSYQVTVKSQPQNPVQSCSISNHSGRIDMQDISNIVVECTMTPFTVGGQAKGLIDSITLYNNGRNATTVKRDGLFLFSETLVDEQSYAVTVETQMSQQCQVENAIGQINQSNVTNIVVNCKPNTYTLGGYVTGLEGNGLQLKSSHSSSQSISYNGNFTFDQDIKFGAMYRVSVASQPRNPSQKCQVQEAQGVVDGDITNIEIHCQTLFFSVGGSVSGLNGSLVIANNYQDTITLSRSGGFQFPTKLADGSQYEVTIEDKPGAQICTLSNESGALAGSDIRNVNIRCQNVFR